MLNTIYFIIVEISSLYNVPPRSVIYDQIEVLLSVYPYFSELLGFVQNSPKFTSFYLFEYKYYKYFVNLYYDLNEYSKIYVYLFQVMEVWWKISENNPIEILSIEVTNMSPLYDPYSEIQQDLDQFGLYCCNISYQDYLPSQQFDDVTEIIIENNQTNIFITNYFNENEKLIINNILKKFPNNLLDRIQNGSRAIQQSISLYETVWSVREFIPNNIRIQQINRLLTSTNCYLLLNKFNLIESNLNQINNLLDNLKDADSETNTNILQEQIQIIKEKYNNLKINRQSNNQENQKLNRLTRRKLTTNKK